MEIVNDLPFVEAFLCPIRQDLDLSDDHVVMFVPICEPPLFKRCIRDGLVAAVKEQLLAVFRTRHQHALDERRSL